MKQKFKVLLILLSVLMIFGSFCFLSSAEDVAYTITSADGTVTEISNPSSFSNSVNNANDGDTITLLKNIEIAPSNPIAISASSEVQSKTINLDLAGHGLYSYQKMNLITVSNYITLNVYSSKKDAFAYVNDGNIFTVGGINARLNCGTMDVGETKYPGSNITTFSSCFVQLGSEGEKKSSFFCDGGTHISQGGTWSGVICLRAANTDVEIKNANILVSNGSTIVSNHSVCQLENCTILSTNEKIYPIINISLGTTTLKNCRTNYQLKSSNTSDVKPNSIILLGENIFGDTVIDERIINIPENQVLAHINYDYKFADGQKEIKCFGKYTEETEFAEKTIVLPNMYSGATFADKGSTFECVWKHLDKEETHIWKKGQSPKAPYELFGEKEDGLYKLGWYGEVDNGKIVYTEARVLDFGIKVSVGYTSYPVINIYIPEFVIKEGYLDFSEVSLNGDYLGKDSWEYKEIDGVGYYKTSTMDISFDINEEYELILACDFGNNKTAKSSWRISAPVYFEKIYANEEKFTPEQMAAVADLKNKVFKSE